MIGYILRGQGVGLMHDRVYTTYPTDEQFKAALAFELERHGVIFESVPDVDEDSGTHKKNDAGEALTVLKAKPRERWVRVQIVEIVGLSAEDQPVPEGARAVMAGVLDTDEMNRILEEARKGPPGTVAAASPEMQISGTGSVTNPGEPGHVPGKPKAAKTAHETMTITQADVANVADVLGKPAGGK